MKVVVVNFVMFVCFDLYVVCTIPVKRKQINKNIQKKKKKKKKKSKTRAWM